GQIVAGCAPRASGPFTLRPRNVLMGGPLNGERAMDPLGSLKSEVLQPALVLIIPGLIAGAPYLFVLDHYLPWVAPFADDHPTLSTFLSLIASAVFGMLVYEFGT